jgi:hypothetical protein
MGAARKGASTIVAILNSLYGKENSMELHVGHLAPDFTLQSHLGKTVTLSDLRGKNVVLAFYPLAWTPI